MRYTIGISVIAGLSAFGGMVAATASAPAAHREQQDNAPDGGPAADRFDSEDTETGDVEAPDAGIEAPDGCSPPCREGYRCVAGLCLSRCSPLCAMDEFCTAHGECVEKYPRRLPVWGDGDGPDYRARAPRGYLAESGSFSRGVTRDTLAWFGAHLGGGATWAAGDVWKEDVSDHYGADRTASIAFGGWFDFHYYLRPNVALVTGLGLLNRGSKKQSATDNVQVQYLVLYMELPLGVKWTIWRMQLGAALALDIGVIGRTREVAVAGAPSKTTWRDEWAMHRRINLAAKLFGGYIFELKEVLVVPGLELSMHTLNDLTVTADGRALSSRYLNLFVTVGLARAR